MRGRRQRLHARRHLQPLDRGDQAIGAAGSPQLVRLDERLDDLLGEERVAAGARVDRIDQAGGAGVVAQQVDEQLANRVRADGAGDAELRPPPIPDRPFQAFDSVPRCVVSNLSWG